MKTIQLTTGQLTTVDDEDYELLSRYRWHANIRKRKSRTVIYVESCTKINGEWKTIRMHRLILGCSEHVDHEDGDGLNNQRYNLRPATPSQNGTNRAKVPGSLPHSSVYKGVTWHPETGKWRIRASKDGKLRSYGLCADEVDAATVYNFIVDELHGEFATMNLPLGD